MIGYSPKRSPNTKVPTIPLSNCFAFAPLFLCSAELSGVRPMIETYPLEDTLHFADEVYERMMSGHAQV